MEKNKKIPIVSLLILLTLIFSSCKCKKIYTYEISTSEKLEEYDDLWEFLEENFSEYLRNLEILSVNKDQLKKDYRKKIKETKNFDEYYNVLNTFTHEFRTLGHIEVYSHDNFLKMYETYKNFDKTKKEIEKNNPSDIDLAENSYNIYSSFFLNEDSFRRYKEINDKSASLGNVKKPITSKSKNIDIRSYEDEKTLYIKYKDFFANNREENKNLIINELNKFPYEKVIVDIYNNPGGNSSTWWDIVSLLTEKPIKTVQSYCFQGKVAREFSEILINYSKPKLLKTTKNSTIIGYEYEFNPNGKVINKPDKIYIIQGENFSAAEEFCEFARDINWATRLGQPIGGSGQGINYFYKLKNSDLLIRLTISYPCYSDGKLKDLVIEPDVVMEYNVHHILDYVFNDEMN